LFLKKKNAIVTGASRGIGRAIAIRFAENGASLVIAAERNEKRLEETAEECVKSGVQVRTFLGDLALPETSRRILDLALDSFGTVDVLANSAGMITRTPVESLSPEEWQRVMDVNLSGIFYMCQAVLPIMREKRSGKIINISSQMARIPHPSASPSYEASKAGILALNRHLAFHYAKYNINVNAIAPGSIDTDMPKSMTPEAREKLRNGIPLLRLGEPEEVGDCALFLASSMSNYITGQCIGVNGGSLMD
jgi:3-oxoacyl-[acyl-carrier protein] reductase